MKRLSLAVAVAVAVVVALVATACSHPAPTRTTHAATGSSAVTVPVSCRQQYREWNRRTGSGLVEALAAVTSAATGRHGKWHTKLTRVHGAVERASRHPIPACADPRGYWDVLLMHVTAAVSGAHSRSTFRAAVQDVPHIRRQLVAEVAQTAQ